VSELRHNAATRDWVVIASERAKRPHEFRSTLGRRDLPCYDPACPFCPGNEGTTPPAILSYPGAAGGGDGDWGVRVVPNKFAAFAIEGSLGRHSQGLFLSMDGVGAHEVVVECPRHDLTVGTFPREQLRLVIEAYRARSRALVKDPRIELVTIFRNHGIHAGTSLLHPHTQIIGTPVVPPFIRERMDTAREHYDDWGTCLYCEMIRQEMASGERVVLAGEHFVCFAPHASRAPFELWLLPRRHRSSFEAVGDDEIEAMAGALGEVMARLYVGLENPDYNYMVHTAPFAELDVPYYHWQLQILPRLTTPAGFELGSGIYITTAYPEESARYLRELTLPAQPGRPAEECP
jgi:UDPglucose--hexose-1-phosphate uridylyltransferase